MVCRIFACMVLYEITHYSEQDPCMHGAIGDYTLR